MTHIDTLQMWIAFTIRRSREDAWPCSWVPLPEFLDHMELCI